MEGRLRINGGNSSYLSRSHIPAEPFSHMQVFFISQGSFHPSNNDSWWSHRVRRLYFSHPVVAHLKRVSSRCNCRIPRYLTIISSLCSCTGHISWSETKGDSKSLSLSHPSPCLQFVPICSFPSNLSSIFPVLEYIFTQCMHSWTEQPA